MYGRLIEALEQRFDIQTEDGRCEVQDVANHGIQSGFSGFLYTTEIVEFYNEHEDALLEYLNDMDITLAQCAEGADSLSDIQTQVVWICVECWCAQASDEIDSQDWVEEVLGDTLVAV